MGVRAKALTVVGPRPRGCDIGVHGGGFVAVPGRPARLGDVSVWGWTRWAVRCAGFPGQAGLGMPGAGFEPFRLSRGAFRVSRGPF